MARGRKRKTEKGLSNENDMKAAVVTGSEPKGPIRIKETLKDRPVIRRPIRCQDGIDREGPIQFRALGRTAPKSVDQSGCESRLTRSHPTMHISEHPRCIGHSRLDRLEIGVSFYSPYLALFRATSNF
jgi:hypothetical protein